MLIHSLLITLFKLFILYYFIGWVSKPKKFLIEYAILFYVQISSVMYNTKL